MLDRNKLTQELLTLSDKLFADCSPEFDIVHKIWQTICNDPALAYRIKEVSAPWPLPSWQGTLGTVFSIANTQQPYCIVSIDGSQVYPDRHQGFSCYVINIGQVIFDYGNSVRPVTFCSEPFVFGTEDEKEAYEFSTDAVNAHRQELELSAGLSVIRAIKKELPCDKPLLLLFDGSLIFWHLESKDNSLRDIFLPRYLALLNEFAREGIIVASYISAPKSKELVNIIRLVMSDFNPEHNLAYQMINRVSDANIMQFYLDKYERSIVFKNNAKISSYYLDYVQPWFFYVHGHNEIGRIEIPAWIARNETLVNQIAHIVIDQCIKGQGYPVSLAEAHEQAVIKGPDRDFFYHVLSKISFERKHRFSISQKSLKKRGIGV